MFREAVLVRGNLQTVFLNDIVLSEGYLTTSNHQTFNLNVTLASAFASHVEVRGLVNSWNLPREWNRTLLVSDSAVEMLVPLGHYLSWCLMVMCLTGGKVNPYFYCNPLK